MSSITWKYNSNGDWDKAANWSGGVLPGATDNVILSTLSARVITHSHSTDTINNLTATTDTLSVTGGTLSILGTATLSAGLATSGGMLAFLGTAASVGGTFSGTGGQITLGTGTALTFSATTTFGGTGANNTGVEIDGAGTLTTSTASSVAETGNNGYYAAFVLGGGATWINTATVSAAGYIVTGDGAGLTASLINKAGANFNLTTDDASIYNGTGYNSYGQQVAGSSVFSNAGTFAKTGGAGGTSHVYSVFTNTGLVESESGTLEFDGSVNNSATILAAGGNLNFAGGGVFNGTISGGGTVTFSNGGTLGGTLTETGTLAFAGGSTTLVSALTLSTANILLDGGLVNLGTSLNLSTTNFTETLGTLNLAGNTLTLSNANLVNNFMEGPGTLAISGTTSIGGTSGAMAFGGSLTLVNSGTVNDLNTINVFYQTNAGFTINNTAGANFNVQGDYVIGQNNYNGTTPSFTNAGTFTKASGTGTTGILANFSSTGVVNASTGLIAFDSGGTLGGSLTGTGSIAFAGGTMALSAGLSDQVASLFVDGATVNLSANQNLATSTFTETSGAIYLNGNTLTLGSAILSNGYIEGGALSTSGTVTASGYITGGNLCLGSGLAWTNSGVINQFNSILVDYGSGAGFSFVNTASASYNVYGDYAIGTNNYNGTGSTFSNAGTFAKVAGLNVTQVISAFTNSGLITAATGTIDFAGGGSFGGTLSGAGTVAFGGGNATLTAAASLQSAGLLLEGGSLTMGASTAYAGSYTQIGGALYLAGTTLTLTNANIGGYYVEGAGTLVLGGTTTLAGYSNDTVYLGTGLTLINSGTLNQNYNVYVDYLTGAGFAITNQAGATYNTTSDYYIGANNANGVGSTFSNAGTFAKTGGTGSTQVISVFSNTGIINAASAGAIQFNSGGSFAGTLSGTGTVAFAGGTSVLANGVSVKVANLLLNGSSLTLGGNINYATGTYTQSSGTLSLGGHTLTLTGADIGGYYVEGAGSIVTSGTTTLAGYNGYFTLYLGSGLSLLNKGTINQAYNVYVDYLSGSGFAITNQAGATYNDTGDYNIGANNNNGVGSTFSNAGTFAKTGGTNTSQVFSTFTNTGLVEALTTGTIEFDGGGTLGGTLAGTGTIAFGSPSGNETLASGVSLTVASLLIDNGNLTIAGPTSYTGSFTFDSGYLYLGGNTLSLTGANLGYGTIDGPGQVSISGTTTVAGFNNQGYPLYLGAGAVLSNSGVVNQNYWVYVSYQTGSGFSAKNLAGASWNINGDFGIGGNNYNGTSSSFSNAGTLTKSAGTNTSQLISVVTNTGIITAATGTIEFDGNGSTIGGTLSGAGQISFASNTETLSHASVTVANMLLNGATLVLGSGETLSTTVFTQTNGTLLLSGYTFNVAGADFAYGTLESGTLSTHGTTTLANNNTVTIGSALAWTNSGQVNQDYYVNTDNNSSGAGFSVTNTSAGTWNMNGDFNLGQNGGVGSSFSNAGLFERTAGNSYDLVYSNFTNTGTITASVGEIAFESGGTFGGAITGPGLISFQNNTYTMGGLTAAATASLQFYQSTIMLTSATTISGTLNGIASTVQLAGQAISIGGLTVTQPGQGLTFDGAGTFTTTGASNIVDWYSNGLMFDVGGGATWANTGIATISGLVQFGDSDLVNGIASGTLINSAAGVFDLATDDASIIVGTYSDGYGTRHSSLGTITNAGIFAKTGGTGTSNVYAALTSTGTLATTSGTLALDNGGGVSGHIADGSTILLRSGSFADAALVIGGGSVVTNAGTIIATGALTLGDSNTTIASFSNTGTYDINGNVGIANGATPGSVFTNTGTIAKIGGTGRGVISVGVFNTGTIAAISGTLALTGSVTGIGALTIGAGAELELASGVAATQSVSFTAAGGTLLLDSPASAQETISGLVVGETIDLAKLVATSAAVNANNQLVVKNGNKVVATLQLSGAHTGDVYSVATDNNGGSLITVAKTTTAWTGTSADWLAASVWTNGLPGAATDATIASTGTYSDSLNYGETASVKSLIASAANATTTINGTLNVGTTLTVSAGAFVLNGTINGGVFANTGGGSVAFGGGLLNNVAYQGLLDLSGTYNAVSLAGTTTLAGAGGSGNGTINLDGYQAFLYADGFFTLDKATIDIGNSPATSYLESIDPDGQGGILTLGSGLSIVHTGINAVITDQGGSEDAVYNEGTITAGLASGQFTVAGNDFQNDGKITITNGDDFKITAASFVNTGTLTSTGSTLAISGNLQNTGSITATNTLLNLGGPITGAQLAAMALGGDTVNLSGSLNLGTTALTVGPTAKITALTLTGSISNGTITAPGAAITFNAGATLNNVTYSGTIAIGTSLPVNLDGVITGAVISDPNGSATFGTGMILNKDTYDGTITLTPGDNVGIEGTLKPLGASGTGVGTITAAGGATSAGLYVLDTETLNNATINSGANGGQGLFLSAAEPTGGTLTLGTKLTFNVLANSTAGLVSLSQTTQQALGDAIVNTGLIALAAGSTFQGSSGSIGTFTNAARITLATGAAWTTDGGTLTTEAFINTSAGSITLGSNATLLTNGGGLTNAGTIAVGANAILTDQGNFTETGKASVAAGGTFSINGTTTLTDLAGISGAGTLGIDGTLNLSTGSFDMAATGRITNVVFAGLIENGTVLNDKGTLSFGSVATLQNIVWEGPLNIGAGATVQAQSLTVETSTGGTPGVINLTNGANLDYLVSGTVDNVTINSSSPNAGVGNPALSDGIELGASGGTLTLGSHFVLNATSGATQIIDAGAASAASALVNNGAINVTAGALWLLDPSFGSVLNNGSITMGTNTEIGANPSATGTGNFTNAGTLTMASLDDVAVTGNAINSGLWTVGAGGEVTIGGNFTNSGKLTMATGSSLEVTGTVTNTGTIIATAATPDLISGNDAAGSSYNNGTLTGGVWQVSANSTLTLGFDTALTTDNADIILSGKNSILQSVGTAITRIETTLGTIGSAGTLAVLGSRGFATKLALTDSGVLQLQTSALSTGGLTISSGGTLLGSGSVAGAISNAGIIDATGGTLVLSAAVTGAGVLDIGTGAVLEIGVANAETVAFLSATSQLKLDAPTSFTGTLSGFVAGDSIDLAGTSVTAATLNGTSLTATLSGGGTEVFKLAASSALTTLTVTSDGASGSVLTYPGAGSHKPPASPTPQPIPVPHAAMSFLAPPAAAAAASIDLSGHAALVTSLTQDATGTGAGWRGAHVLAPDNHQATLPALLHAASPDIAHGFVVALHSPNADPHTLASFWRV